MLPVWRIHRHVGMGGDKLVAALAGEDVERRVGAAVRDEWERLFDEALPDVEPLAGAAELVRDLRARGLRVVLASSSIERHVDAFVDLLGVRDDAHAWTTKDDVEASKPEPDLVEAALAEAGTRDAVMLGDTPWDVEAARRAGVETVCVLTGGFSAAELHEAGAVAVFESVAELGARLDETPFLAGAS